MSALGMSNQYKQQTMLFASSVVPLLHTCMSILHHLHETMAILLTTCTREHIRTCYFNVKSMPSITVILHIYGTENWPTLNVYSTK